MPNDIVTFAVEGEITLERFAVAIRRFTDLMAALSRDLAGGEIVWVLNDLEYGSAIATARAIPKDDTLWPKVEEVIGSYLTVGTALESHEPIPFSDYVEKRALNIRTWLSRGDNAVRFETSADDVTIFPPQRPVPMARRTYQTRAFGAVRGRVQALTNRGSLRFTVYDITHDRAVSCYMTAGQEDLMKDLWGKLVAVEGVVKRNAQSGLAQSIRNIRTITPLPESEPLGYLEARGAVKRLSTQPRAEDVIRRMRDAG